MKTNKLVLTQNDCNKRAQDMLLRIQILFATPKKILKAYPVPRGGVSAAYLLKALSAEVSNCTVQLVSDPKYADVIVDDIVDSGKTKNKYAEGFSDIPFESLVNKITEQNIAKHWVVFPWENETDSPHTATDIPLRLLQYIGEDVTRGGLIETPERFLQAWQHYTSGYSKQPQDILKQFEDGAEAYHEMVLVKDIPVFSHCEHHLAPFYGVAHVAYVPNGRIVGLSKIPRLVDMFMRRLQVQERLTSNVANALEENLSPLGVAVVIECAHTCMISRGVQVQGSTTVTSSMRGIFLTQPSVRAEFMGLLK